MEITRRSAEHALELSLTGRLDSYWADHLETSLAEYVREGHDRLRLDLSQVGFLSSAGIAVLMKFQKQLRAIGGSLVVVKPSPSVRTVLEITRLAEHLVAHGPTEVHTPTAAPAARVVDGSPLRLQIFDIAPGQSLACRLVGDDGPLRTAGYTEADGKRIVCTDTSFALGLGAFGESFAECRNRYGEFLAIAGAAAYLPADGSNVADYLVGTGSRVELQVLYALVCEGQFAMHARFEAPASDPVSVVDLARTCLDAAAADQAGVVFVAEAAGLVGAALRRSPAQVAGCTDLFAHPDVRSWLTFTSERAFARMLVLGAGVIARQQRGTSCRLLRPLGGTPADPAGHFHAAVFPFRPLRRGVLDLRETVTGLFEAETVQGVLHLVADDRAAGAGQSAFVRGACWIGPIGGVFC